VQEAFYLAFENVSLSLSGFSVGCYLTRAPLQGLQVRAEGEAVYPTSSPH